MNIFFFSFLEDTTSKGKFSPMTAVTPTLAQASLGDSKYPVPQIRETHFHSPGYRIKSGRARCTKYRDSDQTHNEGIANSTEHTLSTGFVDYLSLQYCSFGLLLDELFQLLAIDNAVYNTLGLVLEPQARRETVREVSQLSKTEGQ